MADVYWREENDVVDKFLPTLRAFGTGQIRAVVSELAFDVFCRTFDQKSESDGPSDELVAVAHIALPNVVHYVNRFYSTGKIEPFQIPGYRVVESAALAVRLFTYFREYEKSRPVIKRPVFPGCGSIAPCEGDLRVGRTLYEVKTVDRTFRSIDMRQLLVYCALNRAAGLEPIARLGLINPLLGTYWVRDLDHVAYRVAGTIGAELLDDIIQVSLSPARYI